ncbi:PepSY-associated TM helix domain-containing protein [Sphingobacterium chuzhouense]|uniref:PepSY domain-containing protein n=1 Tax=Sphingobacterium chuzhouense TaxID=1742264 RepID=A0ABR7XS11_9SPHI|nr:PepSY-associated TM helix domain-containing protein [Sphingobacterium chuzhouense]MBD1421961.1 PepSY domain-containing protein [Sphingobacterium chuzhouense]
MSAKGKRRNLSIFRLVNNWLHLWLGLISGIIVFIVCLTACLWVFNYEIIDLMIPKKERQYMLASSESLISPSKILAIADSLYPDDFVRNITYTRDYPVSFTVRVKSTDTTKSAEPEVNLLHPYTGEHLGLQQEDNSDEAKLREKLNSFFAWSLSGHRFLWLPRDIGRPIVNYATLIFCITLITGLIWWYPKKWTKSTRAKSFKIKWKAGWKRINIDLHNVVGFYSFLLVLLLAVTGMYYGITWVNRALYWSTNWGQSLAERTSVSSDTTKITDVSQFPQAFDKEIQTILTQYKDPHYLTITYPDTVRKEATISVYIRNDMDRQFNNRYYSFDQYTGGFLPNSISLFNKDYYELSAGEKFRRLNYDIHVGSIWGFPTKVLAFFLTFIAGSLPVTGFIIWYNRKWGKKKKRKPTVRFRPKSTNI